MQRMPRPPFLQLRDLFSNFCVFCVMNAKITEFGHRLMFTEFPLRRFSRANQGNAGGGDEVPVL